MVTTPVPPVPDADRYAVYNPVAPTTDFALKFSLYGDASDLTVYLNGAPLTLGTDYVVLSAATGATLTPIPVVDAFVRLSAAISSGKLEIYGARRPRRTLQATAPYSTRDFNVVFSDIWSTLREMWSQFSRAIQVPVGEDTIILPAAGDRGGKILGFRADGSPATFEPAAVGLVDTPSIIDGAVTTPKIAAQAVGLAQIANSLYGTGAGQLLQLDTKGKVAGSTLDVAAAADLRAGQNASKPLTPQTVLNAMAWVPLADTDTITIDHSAGVNVTMTIAGNRTILNPANAKPGWPLNIVVFQDATGGRTLTWGSNFTWGANGVPSPPMAGGTWACYSFLCWTSGNFIFLGMTPSV